MLVPLLHPGVNRVGVDRSLDRRKLAVGGGFRAGAEGTEAAPHRGDAEVLHAEVDGAMGRVKSPQHGLLLVSNHVSECERVTSARARACSSPWISVVRVLVSRWPSCCCWTSRTIGSRRS